MSNTELPICSTHMCIAKENENLCPYKTCRHVIHSSITHTPN